MQSTNTLVTRKFRTTRLESSASHEHLPSADRFPMDSHFSGEADFPWKTNRLSQLWRAISLLSKSMGIMFQDGNKKQGFRIFEYQLELLSLGPKTKFGNWPVPGPRSISAILTTKSSISRPSGGFIWRTGTSTARWRRRSAGCWWRPWCWAPGRRCPRPRPGAKARTELQVTSSANNVGRLWKLDGIDFYLSISRSVCLSIYLSLPTHPSLIKLIPRQATAAWCAEVCTEPLRPISGKIRNGLWLLVSHMISIAYIYIVVM